MKYTVSSSPPKIVLNQTDTVASVLQNISIILRTLKGTVPMYRPFGIANNFVDRPINAVAPLMHAEIREAIEEYEPRAVLTGIRFSTDPNRPGVLLPTVEVEIHEES